MIEQMLLTRDFSLPGRQNKSQIQMTRIQLSSEHRDTPVSYTHLDVYKRQVGNLLIRM